MPRTEDLVYVNLGSSTHRHLDSLPHNPHRIVTPSFPLLLLMHRLPPPRLTSSLHFSFCKTLVATCLLTSFRPFTTSMAVAATKGIVVSEFGDASVMKFTETPPLPALGKDEVITVKCLRSLPLSHGKLFLLSTAVGPRVRGCCWSEPCRYVYQSWGVCSEAATPLHAWERWSWSRESSWGRGCQHKSSSSVFETFALTQMMKPQLTGWRPRIHCVICDR